MLQHSKYSLWADMTGKDLDQWGDATIQADSKVKHVSSRWSHKQPHLEDDIFSNSFLRTDINKTAINKSTPNQEHKGISS